ncbi:MAG TPA: ion channel [Polyangiaceae bacterium]|jgi:inward rectifier potassium channel
MAETQSEQGVTVIGAPKERLRDVYYQFLRVSWWWAIGWIVAIYLTLNAIFAEAYLALGGVVNVRSHSFWDAFCFSVQTMGTIGYGSMYPTSVAANVVMVTESVVSLLVTALATGLVFAKFSRSGARVVFSQHAVIGPMDGVPTLMIRVGNERGNAILEATIRVALMRTEHLKEGTIFYRMIDLKLTRDRSPAMSRSWTVLHVVDESSPLHGVTPESAKKDEVEILVNLVGTDDTSLQPVHARRRYVDQEVLWGARHADVLSEDAGGNLVLDIRKFHHITPTAPIDGFPYPRDEKHLPDAK